MPRLNFDIDEATLLKAYKIGSLTPKYACTISVSNRTHNNTVGTANGKK